MMKPYAIVAEGPDDVAALRELHRRAGWGDVRGSVREAHQNPLQLALSGISIQIWSAQGKRAELPKRVMDAVSGTNASPPPDTIAVCFDPDADSKEVEFDFFKKHFDDVKLAAASPLRHVDGTASFTISGRSIVVVPAPWRHEGVASIAGVPDEQNLERLLITGAITSAEASLTQWAEDATSRLVGLVSDHGWKRAFRIWNAALEPKSESCVEALLQHDHKAECLRVLCESDAWKAISRLHG